MIMTHYVQSIMQDMQGKVISMLKNNGSFPPILIIISESLTHINLNYLYSLFENIQDISYGEWKNGLHIATFFLHIRDRHESELQKELSKYIAIHHSPLAIGLIGLANYNVVKYDEYEKLKAGTFHLNPDAIQVLYTCFYIKDNKNDFIQTSPLFITEHRPEINKDFDFGLSDEIPLERTVSILPTPWSIDSSDITDKDNRNPFYA